MEITYQYLGQVFTFLIYLDKLIIRRKSGLDAKEWCAVCGQPIKQLSPQRHRRYCSDRCRKRNTRNKSNTQLQEVAESKTEIVPIAEVMFPLEDIVHTSWDHKSLTLEIWTGATKNQFFYVGDEDELIRLKDEIGKAVYGYFVKASENLFKS